MKDLIVNSNLTCKTDFVLIWKRNKTHNFQAKQAEHNSNTNLSKKDYDNMNTGCLCI